ncbi:MAG: WD40 repeat domain-containing protein [Planctomycetota bacterium]|nr:WD40 repeat domain-containing protein [Planctomycetota bacterium]
MADEGGDPARAALWFAHAAQLGADDPERADVNRVRVRAWLRHCYLPERAWLHDRRLLRSLRIHPSGQYLAAAGLPEDRVTLWDVRQDEPLVLAGSPTRVAALAWSPDGNRVALGTPTGQVAVLSFPAGEPLQQIVHHGSIAALDFSPDGRYLALASEILRVWDSQDQVFATPDLPHPQTVVALAFNSRGDRLVTACLDKQARVFRVPSDELEAQPLFAPVPHTVLKEDDASYARPVAPIFVSQDRELLTITRAAEGGMCWRDAADGQLLQTVCEPTVQTIQLSPDRRYVVLGARRKAQLWDVQSRQPVGPPLPHDNDVLGAAFSSDGCQLATAGADDAVRCWTVPDGRAVGPPIPHQTFVHLVSFLPGGKRLVTAQAGGLIRVWQAPDALSRNWRVALEPGSASQVVLSADGRYVVPTSVSYHTGRLRTTRVYEAATGRPAGPPLQPGGEILDVALAPDGVHLGLLAAAGVGQPGTVQIWNWQTGQQVGTPLATDSEPRGLDYHPDGHLVAVLCAEGQLLLVDTAQGHLRRTLDYGPRTHGQEPHEYICNGAVRFDPTGRQLFAWGLDDAVQVYNPATGIRRYPPLQHQGKCHDVDFSRDGRLVVTASYDHTARIWDLETGRALARPIEHPDRVLTVYFSPDGQQVLTARRDTTWRLYNWRTGDVVASAYPLSGEEYEAEFMPNGRWIASVDGATLRIWEPAGKWISPPVKLAGAGLSLVITPDNKYAIASGLGGALEGVYLGDLNGPDDVSLPELCVLSELVSAQRILADTNTLRLSDREWWDLWRRFLRSATMTDTP